MSDKPGPFEDVRPEVLELLQRWHREETSNKPTPEALCAARPDLLDEVRRHISDLAGADAILCDYDKQATMAADVTIAQNAGGRAAAGVAAAAQRSTESARLGSYVVNGALGEGGMGTVCRARDPLLDREVAIKVLKAELSDTATARLLREARAAARLAHPNVVAIHHVVEENGQIQIIMELLGKSLADELKETGAMPWRAATLAMRDAAAGIAAAHKAGMVHRDIKPSNLLRGAQGEVKVVDFGIVHSAEAVTLTMPGSTMGTPAFMAPEQCRGEQADTRSDVYSLACTYYNLLTGRLPFDGTSAYLVMRMHETDSVPDPGAANTNIPAGVRKIIARAGSKDPQFRYKDASEMLADLHTVLGGGSIAFMQQAPGDRRPVSRRLIASLVIGVFTVAGATLLIWKAHRATPPIAAGSSSPPSTGNAGASSSAVPAVIAMRPPGPALPTTAPAGRPIVASPSPDLLTNGSFTDGNDLPDGWRYWFGSPTNKFHMARDTSVFKVGPAALRLETDGPAFGAIEQAIDVPDSPGGSIHITGFAKTMGKRLSWAKVLLHAGEPDAHGKYPVEFGRAFDESDQWKPFTLDVPLPLPDPAHPKIRIMMSGDSAVVWVDEVHATLIPPPAGSQPPPMTQASNGPPSHVDAEGHRVVDLIPLIDADSCGYGSWQREGGEIISKGGTEILSIPYDPPEEYDFSVEFEVSKVIDDNFSYIEQLFRQDGQVIRWWGHWKGAGGTDFGFEKVAGLSASDPRNPTHATKPGALLVNKRYTSVVRVRRGAISALLDNNVLSDYATDFSNLTSAGDHLYRGGLGFACFGSVAIHKMELTEITGNGQYAPLHDDPRLVHSYPMPGADHTSPTLRCICFTSDGKSLIYLGRDVTVWDRASGKVVLCWRGDDTVPGVSLSAAVTSDGHFLAGRNHHETQFVDVAHPESSTVLNGANMQGYVFSPDGSRLVTSAGGAMDIWDCANAKALHHVDTQSQIHRITFSPDGLRILVHSARTNPVSLWDAESLTRLWEADGGWAAYFSKDGKKIISGAETLLNPADGSVISKYSGGFGVNPISPDGKLVVDCRSGYGGSRLIVRDTASGTELDRFKYLKLAVVAAAAWSPDGRWIVIGCADGRLCVIDAGDGNLLTSYSGHAGPISAVAVSPDGKFAATACYDTKIRVFSLPAH